MGRFLCGALLSALVEEGLWEEVSLFETPGGKGIFHSFTLSSVHHHIRCRTLDHNQHLYAELALSLEAILTGKPTFFCTALPIRTSFIYFDEISAFSVR